MVAGDGEPVEFPANTLPIIVIPVNDAHRLAVGAVAASHNVVSAPGHGRTSAAGFVLVSSLLRIDEHLVSIIDDFKEFRQGLLNLIPIDSAIIVGDFLPEFQAPDHVQELFA